MSKKANLTPNERSLINAILNLIDASNSLTGSTNETFRTFVELTKHGFKGEDLIAKIEKIADHNEEATTSLEQCLAALRELVPTQENAAQGEPLENE